MLALEVGAGGNPHYGFRTFIPVGYIPVFLDVEPPSPEVRKRGHWVVADAHMLPFRDSVFSLVVASHVLEHLDDPERALREIYRVLKPGGIAHVRVPNFMSVNARADPSHKHIFNIIKLIRMAKRTGFRYMLGTAAGSRIPKPLRKILHIVLNLLVEELVIDLVK